MVLKPPKTYQEQVLLLKQRGCIIYDDDECVKFLKQYNYYRVSAFFLPFRNNDHSYTDDITFLRIKSIIEFDKKIRIFIYALIEEIELFIRTNLAYYHGHKYGPDGYLNLNNYIKSHQHTQFIKQIDIEIEHNKNALCVMHHKQKYDGKFPIWAIIELFSLGMLSRFYADMLLDDRKKIATDYNTKAKYLENWLRTLTVLRNICAHHGRLYNVMFKNIPRIPPALRLKPTGKLFDQILVLIWLSPDRNIWNTQYLPYLSALIKEYSEHIDFCHIGFCESWESILGSIIKV